MNVDEKIVIAYIVRLGWVLPRHVESILKAKKPNEILSDTIHRLNHINSEQKEALTKLINHRLIGEEAVKRGYFAQKELNLWAEKEIKNYIKKGYIDSASAVHEGLISENDWDKLEDELFPPPKPSEDSFSRYQLIEKIGGGGMGVVYKAYDTKLQRAVAVKMVNVSKEVSDSQIGRFLQEAKALAKLAHPHIVTIFDMGQNGKIPYFTMELIDGYSLGEILDSKGDKWGKDWNLMDLLVMFKKVTLALDYAHANGIVHRDITPSNIMIEQNTREPKLMDFGLAKTKWGKALTQEGNIIGTPLYMSPEQVKGTAKNIIQIMKSDIYSLGAVLYHILTRTPPFEGKDTLKVLHNIVNNEPIPPYKKNPGIPTDISKICMRAMAKAPAKRYERAKDIAHEIDLFLEGQSKKSKGLLRWLVKKRT